jgi:ribosomal protein L40E
MMFSSFAGLIVLGIPGVGQAVLPSEYSNGDMIIGTDYTISNWAIVNRVEYMDGNLTIRSGGVVTITNGGLSFTQDTGPDGIAGTSDDHVYTLIVEDGGTLVLEKSILTTHLDQLNDFPSLGVIVRNGGALEARNSTLKFPGHMVVDDSTLMMWNATVTRQDLTYIEDYCDPTQFQSDAFDDSPVMLFVSSDVYVYDSTIEGLYENSSAPSADMYSHDYSFASDNRDRGVVTYNLTRTVGAFGSTNNAPGEALVNLTTDDSRLFTVGPAERLSIDGLDTAGLAFSDSSDVVVTLHAKYKTDAGYAGSNPIRWGYNDGPLKSSGIVPADTSSPYGPNVEVTGLVRLSRMSSSDLNGLNIDFINNGANRVYFNRIWVTVEMTIPTYRNLTLAGSTQMTAVNSYVGVDFSNDALMHNQLVVLDDANAYMYGVYADMSQNADPSSSRLPAYTTSDMGFNATPSIKGSGDTTVGETFVNLTADDNANYAVDVGQLMAIDEFNVSDLSGSISKAFLTVIYSTQIGYGTGNYVRYGLEGASLKNTTILPTTNVAETRSVSFDLFSNGVRSLEDVADLNVTFVNGGAGRVYFERVWIEVTLRPNIYVYRWMDFKAVDSQSLPVQGAWVNATVSASGTAAYYYTPSGVIGAPPTEVLDYLGKDVTSYKRTNPYGSAMIPLFWEIVNESTMPNSGVLGGYDLNVTYRNVTSVMYYYTTGVSFAPYPALSEADQTKAVTVTLSSLVLDKPDLVVTTLTALPTTVYEDDTVTLTATAANNGLTAATDVLVTFTDFFGGTLTEISNATIPFMLGASSTDVVVSWSNTLPGVHTITAKVDPFDNVIERSESNNELSIQVNVLANLPELSIVSSDIVIDPQPAYTGAQVFANATIRNTLGRANAINAVVEFYIGNPMSGGQLLGSTSVNVPAGGSNFSSFEWVPSQIGEYSIYVYVNRLRAITEYDFTNNLASTDVVVELSTNEFDFVVDDNNIVTLAGTVFLWGANIIVKDNGTLILNDVDLVLVQSSGDQFLIIIQDNGTLILNQSLITSDYSLRLYLFDHASLVVTNGSIMNPVVTIIAEDQSRIDIESSTVHADIIAPTKSSVVMNAANTTFGRTWSSFGGNAAAYLTNVSIPSLSPVDGAVVYHYRWIVVTVVDGKGAPLPGAFVNLEHYLNGTVSGTGNSGSNGRIMFRALCDKITASSMTYFGSYRLNATYWFDDVAYETDGYTTASLEPYSVPLTRDVITSTLTIPDAVRGPADLVALSIVFTPASSPVSVNTHLLMDARADNIGETEASNVVVRFWLGAVGTGTVIDEVTVPLINPGETIVATGEWDASVDVGQKLQTRTIAVEFNPGQIITEISYANNIVTQSILVVDRRPDFVFPDGIEVTSGGHVTEQAVVGESVVLGTQVENDGYTSAMGVVVAFYIMDSDGLTTYLGMITTDIANNATVTANLTWAVNTTSFGQFDLKIVVNPLGLKEEGNYGNNEITAQFQINVPNPVIVINLNGVFSYKAGTDVVVSGTITNEISGEPLIGRPVWVSLVDASGNVIGSNATSTTTSSGSFQTSKYIPIGEEGDYEILVTVQIGDQTFSKSQDITVNRGFIETPTDWWIYAIIIAIVAAIIIFFSVYLYKYGLGKMVECGECGALIPESSKRCPKCGVEFEAGTAKCSECGAWIPASSGECPECGAKFVTAPIPEEEDEYMKKMREQYQQFVDGYREQAKGVLGKKFSEAKFADWWKKQPSHITFEKWLSQEEERRKLGAFACPVCGTLNPRGAKVCHKCGTVFETPKEAPKEEGEEEGKPRLRRIVKRPVEKKVLKKAEEAQAEERSYEQPGAPPEEESSQDEEPKTT